MMISAVPKEKNMKKGMIFGRKNPGTLTLAVLTIVFVSVFWGVMPAGAVLLTDPDDPRIWQGASVGTFAQLIYGSNTLANRQQVIADGLLDDGTFNTSGVGFGSYYGNNLGCSGFSFADGTYNYTCGTESLAQYTARGNDLDWEWLQDLGDGGTSWTQGNVWDLGGPSNQAVVFPIIDHGPLPNEAIEYSVYLSNNQYATTIGSDGNTQWVAADLERAYLEGWDSTQIADGFTTVWRLPDAQTFQYVNVFSGGPAAFFRDGDDEIDTVAGLTFEGNPANPVPEPGTVLLLASGLAGIAAFRKKFMA
jgi:hypothetical protein